MRPEKKRRSQASPVENSGRTFFAEKIAQAKALGQEKSLEVQRQSDSGVADRKNAKGQGWRRSKGPRSWRV